MNTTTLQLTDEMLSAFLDGELAPAEMEMVRAALARDSVLASRIATLARVDELVQRRSRAIDERPMPAAVLALLDADAGDHGDNHFSGTHSAGNQSSDKVVQGPWLQRRKSLPALFALAATLVLAVTIALRYGNDDDTLPALARYSNVLATTPSGTEAAIDNATLLGRFSFRNQAGQYCRQYRLASAGAVNENIACHDGNDWTLVASVQVEVQSAGSLQPASVPASLDGLLNDVMQGTALDLATEQALINRNWQP